MVIVLALGGCGETYAAPARIEVTSPAFADGGRVPEEFTCDGADRSPPLQWSRVPRETKQIVLVMADHGAADPPFIQWVVTGIDPATTGASAGSVPRGGRELKNEFNRTGWSGPCPLEGDGAHRYVFTVTASRSAARSMTEAVARDNVIARGQISATYVRG